jgi:hypothetical protein
MVICLGCLFQLKLLYTEKGVTRTPSGRFEKWFHLILRSDGLEAFLSGAGFLSSTSATGSTTGSGATSTTGSGAGAASTTGSGAGAGADAPLSKSPNLLIFLWLYF